MSAINAALEYDTQETINDCLRELSPAERKGFVRQEATNDNFVLFEYETKGTYLTNTIEDIIQEIYIFPTKLNELIDKRKHQGNYIPITTENYYAVRNKEKKDAALDDAVQSMFLSEGSFKRVIKTDEEYLLVKSTLGFIIGLLALR